MEFFDFNRLSRPADFNTAVSVSLAPAPTWKRFISLTDGGVATRHLIVAHIIQYAILFWYVKLVLPHVYPRRLTVDVV